MPADDDLAGDLVRAAGELAAGMLAAGLITEHKTSISDVVSAADHAAEALIVERLRSARPADRIVGEEGTAEPGDSDRVWYVDPVDGTYNFLAGLPIWCSALGLADASGPILGAIFEPVTGNLWCGGVGVPAVRNGTPLAPLDAQPLAEIALAAYLHPPRFADDTLREPLLRAVGGAAVWRMLGSGSVELAAVAAGGLGAWVQADTHPWDWVPGAALVRAAGGVAEIHEAHGHRWHVAGNRRAVDDLMSALDGA